MNKVAIYLNRHISGNVYDKDSILEAYSTDRSILKIKPRYVAIPESSDDIKKLARFINQLAIRNYKLPIAVRGSGLDTTGADLTPGLVISTERLSNIKEIDAHDRLVHVEAGVTLGQLNSALSAHGLTLPVNSDPSETIGSLIANYSLDSYSAKSGSIMNYVDRAEIVLASGDTIQTSPMGQRALTRRKQLNTIEGSIYRDISRMTEANTDILEKIKEHHNFAGYPNIIHCNRKNNKNFDLLPLFFGSQSTLGVITEVILRAEVISPAPKRILASFGSFRTANEFLYFAKKLNPLELDFYNLEILKDAEKSGKSLPILKSYPKGGYLVYASFTDSPRNSQRKIDKCLEFLPKSAHALTETKKNASVFNNIYNSLSSYLNNDSTGERIPIINSIYVPLEATPKFISDLHFIEEKHKISLPVYGSYSTGVYSIRPDFNITTAKGRRFIIELLSDINTLLKTCAGSSLTGACPEGRFKALFANRELSPIEKKFYKAIKETFDPNRILAPDIKLFADPRTTMHHFRTTTKQAIIK